MTCGRGVAWTWGRGALQLAAATGWSCNHALRGARGIILLEKISDGGISPPLHIPKLTLPQAHTELPKPQISPGENFATFLEDENFPRIYPARNYPPTPPYPCTIQARWCKTPPRQVHLLPLVIRLVNTSLSLNEIHIL